MRSTVFYAEFENISGADKNVLEVVGHDGQSDLTVANPESRQEHKHEGELKLILSSNVRDWNASENFIAEKNFGARPVGIRICSRSFAAIEHILSGLHILHIKGARRSRSFWWTW